MHFPGREETRRQDEGNHNRGRQKCLRPSASVPQCRARIDVSNPWCQYRIPLAGIQGRGHRIAINKRPHFPILRFYGCTLGGWSTAALIGQGCCDSADRPTHRQVYPQPCGLQTQQHSCRGRRVAGETARLQQGEWRSGAERITPYRNSDFTLRFAIPISLHLTKRCLPRAENFATLAQM